MSELLQLGMLVPTGAAACCVAANRRRRTLRDGVPTVVMLAAMLDLSIPGLLGRPALLPPAFWFAALVACALLAAFPARRRTAAGARDPVASARRADAGVRTPVASARLPVRLASPSAPPAPRVNREIGDRPAGRLSPMITHRALSCVVMAALLLAGGMSATQAATAATTATTTATVTTAATVTTTATAIPAAHGSMTGMAMFEATGGTGSLGLLLAGGGLAIAAFGGVVAVRHWRASRLASIDAAAMSLSVIVMLVAM
ncbi:hypothetical protein [Subtercola sp. YIM 133946]|uniref:hypothetical protein n=1 Tax=Subtercola sp. YIM 133946 TaxID=3118909 RepID=UPI002F95AD94